MAKEIAELFNKSIRGEICKPVKEVFSMHSDKLIDALLKMSNLENKAEENYVFASTLMPSIINELVKCVFC